MLKKLKQTLKTLVAFETITGNQKETEKALDWIHDVVKQHTDVPLHVTKHCFDTYPALTITTQHTHTPALWLAAHIDVVPGGKELFRMREREGRLYGRGTYDMKFAIACYIELLKELNEKTARYDFGIMITSDEETGGWNGTHKLIEKGYTSASCFLPDGGENWVLEEQVKGVWHVELTSKGVSSHGSRPWEGKNAIQELQIVLAELLKEFDQHPEDPTHFHRTMTISNIAGGNGAVNKVPDSAEATLDIRFTSNDEQRYLEKRLQEIEEDHPGVAHQTRILVDSFSVSPKNTFTQAFRECIPTGKGEGRQGSLSHGSSDARFFASKNIPTVVTRPLGGGAHSNTEWIDATDLEVFYNSVKRYVEKVARAK